MVGEACRVCDNVADDFGISCPRYPVPTLPRYLGPGQGVLARMHECMGPAACQRQCGLLPGGTQQHGACMPTGVCVFLWCACM